MRTLTLPRQESEWDTSYRRRPGLLRSPSRFKRSTCCCLCWTARRSERSTRRRWRAKLLRYSRARSTGVTSQHSINTQAMSAPDTPNLRTSQSHSGKSVTVRMPSQMFRSQAFHGNATPGAHLAQARNMLSGLLAWVRQHSCRTWPGPTSPTVSHRHTPDRWCRKFNICASFRTGERLNMREYDPAEEWLSTFFLRHGLLYRQLTHRSQIWHRNCFKFA